MCLERFAVVFTILDNGVNYVNLDGITGIECLNCDSVAYAKALKKLCDDEFSEKYGNANREGVVNNFTVVQFENNMRKLIEEL